MALLPAALPPSVLAELASLAALTALLEAAVLLAKAAVLVLAAAIMQAAATVLARCGGRRAARWSVLGQTAAPLQGSVLQAAGFSVQGEIWCP